VGSVIFLGDLRIYPDTGMIVSDLGGQQGAVIV